MRGSRFMVLLYAGMIGIPLLLVLRLFAYHFNAVLPQYVLTFLIGIGLVVYGATGFVEVYAHRNDDDKAMKLGFEESESKAGTRHVKGATAVELRIRRFNWDTKSLEEKAYTVDATMRTTVLDALIKVKEEQDQTLSMRYSCRSGICGSCGMVVNGKPTLVCECNLLDSVRKEGMTVEPMQGLPLLKDLVTDFDYFFEAHKSVGPHVIGESEKERYTAAKAIKQSGEQRNEFLPYSYCIMCGLCLDACPVVNSNPKFVGPQALSQVYRYYKDHRDKEKFNRLIDIDSMEGAWGCEFAGTCSEVCPKGVDPASAIQLLKGELVKNIAKEAEENTRKD